jgi:hypothetical protein
MPFVPVTQFSAAIQSLLGDGFEPVRGLALTKGRKALRLMQNGEDGAIAAVGTVSKETRLGTVEAAITSDAMLCTSLMGAPERLSGLMMRIDSAIGVASVMPIAGLEAMYQHERFTASLSASPAQGLVVTASSGAEPFMLGAAALLQPDGTRSTLLGATLGGALNAIVTLPHDAAPLLHGSMLMQPTEQLLLGGMVEKAQGAPATVAFGAAYTFEEYGFSSKAMVVSGAVDGPSGPAAFSIAKAALTTAVDRFQLGVCVELPVKLLPDTPRAPKFGFTLGISLDTPSPADA